MSLKFKPLKPFFPLHCQPTGWQYVGRLLELIVCDENEQVLDDGWQIENRSLENLKLQNRQPPPLGFHRFHLRMLKRSELEVL